MCVKRLIYCVLLLVAFADRADAAADVPLVNAVRSGDVSAVRSLLGSRADVNAKQPDGATALMWAAHLGHQQIVDLLIAAGADVNAANDYGATPLWLASSHTPSISTSKIFLAPVVSSMMWIPPPGTNASPGPQAPTRLLIRTRLIVLSVQSGGSGGAGGSAGMHLVTPNRIRFANRLYP